MAEFPSIAVEKESENSQDAQFHCSDFCGVCLCASPGTNVTFMLVNVAIMSSTSLFLVLNNTLYTHCHGAQPGCVHDL